MELVEGLLANLEHLPTSYEINKLIRRYGERKAFEDLPTLVQVNPTAFEQIAIREIKALCQEKEVTLPIVADKTLPFLGYVRIARVINGDETQLSIKTDLD